MEHTTEKQYIITRLHGVTMGFLLVNGHPEEIHCYEESSRIGNIYVGRVSNIVPNINAAFVDISKGESCYLSLEDYRGEKPVRTGDLIAVQVVKDKIKTKQAAVTANVSLTGNYVIVQTDHTIGVSSKIKDAETRNMLKRRFTGVIQDFQTQKKCADIEYGGIIRTKAEHAASDFVENETVKLLCELDDVMHRAKYSTAYACLWKSKPTYITDIDNRKDSDISVQTDLPEVMDACKAYGTALPKLYQDAMISMPARYGLEKVLDKALSKRVYLKSGAYLIVEPTEALTVIDVNSGKAIKGKDAEEIRYKLNVEAAYEVARQMKLRNLSGIIIVDFISMKSEQMQKSLLNELASAAACDSVPVNIVDITRLGLVEITRKKVRKPLHEVI